MDKFWEGFDKAAGVRAKLVSGAKSLKQIITDIKDAPKNARKTKEEVEKIRKYVGVGTATGIGLGTAAAASGVSASNAKRRLYDSLTEKVKAGNE